MELNAADDFGLTYRVDNLQRTCRSEADMRKGYVPLQGLMVHILKYQDIVTGSVNPEKVMAIGFRTNDDKSSKRRVELETLIVCSGCGQAYAETQYFFHSGPSGTQVAHCLLPLILWVWTNCLR